MRILLALNSFKGSCTSIEANESVAKGILKSHPDYSITSFPVCDGGDGSLDALKYHLGYKKIWAHTVDALGIPIYTYYLIDEKNHIAYIEMAKASGLAVLSNKESSIFDRNTVGTGLLINHAIEKGVKKIVLLIGGSATNDAGLGILSGMGYKFINKKGNEVQSLPGNLGMICTILPPGSNWIQKIKFEVWTDVLNPMTGKDGAVAVYSAQKGANYRDRKRLENQMIKFHDFFLHQYKIKLNSIPGTGAAGGIAAGMIPLLNANIFHGTKKLFELFKLESTIKNHDCIITGEGRIDHQSAYGKLIKGIVDLSKKHNKNIIGVCGKNDLDTNDLKKLGLKKVYSIVEIAQNLQDAIRHSQRYLFTLGVQIDFG